MTQINNIFKNEWFNITIIKDEIFNKLYCSNNENDKVNNNTLDTVIIPFDNKSINQIQFDPSTINDYFLFLYKSNTTSNNNNKNKKLSTTKYNNNKKEILLSFDINYNHNHNNTNYDNNNNKRIIIISNSNSKKLNLIENDLVHLKTIKKKLTVLQRVVLLANDNESFIESSIPPTTTSTESKSPLSSKYLVNEEFRNYLVENSILFSIPNNIIISNDFNNKSFSYKVLECYPLLQGTVSNSTTIIILSPDDKILNTFQKPIDQEDKKQQVKEEKEKEKVIPSNNLRLSSFIIHPISGIVGNNESSSSSSNLFHFIPSSKSSNINNVGGSSGIQNICQLNPISKNIDFESDISKDYDYLVDSLVSINTLKQLNLFNGSWVKILSGNSNNEIVIKIYSTNDCNLKDGIIYITPLSIYNLSFDFKSTLKLSNGEIIKCSPSPSSSSSLSLSIDVIKSISNNFPINYPVANRIKISRIKNQNSNGYKSYSTQLENYFEKKRLLKQGDQIIISTTTGNKLVYFKVDTIICNQFENINGNQVYIIDKNTTSIIQEGSSNSMIPTKIESFYNRICNGGGNDDSQIDNQLNNSNNEIPLETIYKDEFKHIVDLILPFLITDKYSFDFNCTLLLHGPQGVGKRTLLNRVAKHLGIHVFQIDCFKIYDFVEGKKDSNLKQALEKAYNNSPTLLILNNFDILEQTAQSMQQEKKESSLSTTLLNILKELNDGNGNGNNGGGKSKYPLIISATVNSLDELSNKVRNWFKHEIILNAPDENQRFKILKYLVTGLPIDKNSISIKNLSIRTASFLVANLKTLIQRSSVNALKRVLLIQSGTNDEIEPIEIYNCGFTIISDDVSSSLSEMQEFQSSSIGAPKIPNVSWNDVGGLANVKSEIMDTIQLPLEHPHLFASGIGKRSGILLYGPPGTGKTLLAKAIATECSLNFLSVKGPELINMYIGESEKNIREIFNKARQAKPCVIFFDELDSLAPSRGNGADSGGVMDRVVSQLLAELDGMQKSSDVFIIGATNRPDLLDSSLMRPGRLDRLLYLGISSEKENQFKICQALTRKFNLHQDVDLRTVVKDCPMNLTGADFYALCSDALANSMKDKINQLTSGEITEDEISNHDQKLVVHQKHFIQAVNSLVPSVSLDELEYYHKVQKQFSNNK